MNPTYQTKFGQDKGNCLAACLASIFEISIDEIPDFGIQDSWYSKFQEWMIGKFGLQPVDIETKNSNWNWLPAGYHIINGPSPRGNCDHAVVGFNGKMAHDPHPDNAGVARIDSFTVFVKVLK